MKIDPDPKKTAYFEDHMGEHPDWMHHYRFGEEILTGHYKYQGIKSTFVNSRSPESDIAAMRKAYEAEDFTHPSGFRQKLFSLLPNLQNMAALDIAAATGQLSIAASDAGFKRVIASELRLSQVEQFRLIQSCAAERRYANIESIHDPVSADDMAFPDRYKNEGVDCAFSMGLLYHLTNPLQHLVNLAAITSRYAVVYTMTHSNYFAQNKWELTVENPEWMTKAVSGISWTPFYLDVPRLLKAVGFKTVKIVYPDLFETNFKPPAEAKRHDAAKWIIETALYRVMGLRIGAQKNFDFAYFLNTGLNPNYFAYVCEK
jgi:hypothetical protein